MANRGAPPKYTPEQDDIILSYDNVDEVNAAFEALGYPPSSAGAIRQRRRRLKLNAKPKPVNTTGTAAEQMAELTRRLQEVWVAMNYHTEQAEALRQQEAELHGEIARLRLKALGETEG